MGIVGKIFVSVVEHDTLPLRWIKVTKTEQSSQLLSA